MKGPGSVREEDDHDECPPSGAGGLPPGGEIQMVKQVICYADRGRKAVRTPAADG